MHKRKRYLGSLLGLAVGDALGTTLEFQPPGSFEPITDMIGGGPFDLEPGQWTDDTSMALCLAESLIECNGFDPVDQLNRYLRWLYEGHLSSTGTCFDIGNTTLSALRSFDNTGNPNSGPTDERSAGNGSVMRLAPVPLFYANNPQDAIKFSGESSKTTHGNQVPIDACRFFGGLIVGAVNGIEKEKLLSSGYKFGGEKWGKDQLEKEIYEISLGSFKEHEPPDIRGTGYVVRSLEAALWAFNKSNTFKDGCLLAVNLGNDADTTGAVYGQLAGAYYGVDGIPQDWAEKITDRSLIENFANKILEKVEGSD